MDIALISTTAQGEKLLHQLFELLTEHGHLPEQCSNCSLSGWMMDQFVCRDALIVIGSLNQTTRCAAPALCKYQKAPAILVMDHKATFCIPLLDGEDSSAELLAELISEHIGCVPVLPMSDVATPAFDVAEWAKSQNIIIENPGQIKSISAKLTAGIPVNLLSLVEISGESPKNLHFTSAPSEADVFLTVYDFTASAPEALRLVPPIITLGVSCRKGVSCEQIEKTVLDVFELSHIHVSAIYQVSCIDTRLEPGLSDFCEKHRLSLIPYTARQLSAVKIDFRRNQPGVRCSGVENACERAAVLGAGEEKAMMLISKTSRNGVTLAAAANTGLVENYRFPQQLSRRG